MEVKFKCDCCEKCIIAEIQFENEDNIDSWNDAIVDFNEEIVIKEEKLFCEKCYKKKDKQITDILNSKEN